MTSEKTVSGHPISEDAVLLAAGAIWQTWQDHHKSDASWEDAKAAYKEPHLFPKLYEAYALAIDEARAALMAGISTPATNARGIDTAIAVIEARLPIYTDIGQINALRECISSIRGAAATAPGAETNGRLLEAANGVIASASDTYKKRNGHLASFQDDSGEKCWIVPFDAFEELRAALATATEDELACPVCLVAFQPDDLCATDIELGICHAECLEGSPVVDLDTGKPAPDGELHTYRFSETDPTSSKGSAE